MVLCCQREAMDPSYLNLSTFMRDKNIRHGSVCKTHSPLPYLYLKGAPGCPWPDFIRGGGGQLK